ncbi:MAG: heparinase II/III family protein [Ignavibacteria bacterium]|nr:heparinase II/III family protein [Ignavibacteria bacterium]
MKELSMFFDTIKIIYIYFVRRFFFVQKVKINLFRKNLNLNANYFLDSNNFFDEAFKSQLLNIQSENQILEEAELIIRNKFQTLGSDVVYLGEKINWHQDFKSGRIWLKEFYTKINSKHSINKSDIKVPWELSRFHQGQFLAKAFVITGDEKYAKKFFDLINDWIEENPFCYGVNWNCAMEVAIRAVNWIFALHIFKHSKHFTTNVEKKIYNSLYLHGLFIRNNLEYGRRRGNHYLSDLMGLIWIGAFFNEHWFGKRWFKFGVRQLEKEMFSQVYSDGVDYEKSTFYQRLVTEIFTLSTIAVERNHTNFSEGFKERLHKMFKFIASYVLNDEVPNVGDCDDGRVIKFNFFEKVSEMRNLLSIGSVIFNDNELRTKAEKVFVDLLFLFGKNGVEKFSELQTIQLKPQNQIFNEGGFAVLRTKNFFIFFDFGDIGMNGWGGHGHNDILSFELAYMNKRFIVDSGTYVYTPEPELRQKFRSTYSHNTIVVDGKEQAEFLNLFRIKNDLSNTKFNFIQQNNETLIEGEHYCYSSLKNPVIVKRKILINETEEKIKIEDNFIGNGQNKIEIIYHFHPEVEVHKITNSILQLKRNDLILKLELTMTEHYIYKLEESLYSESYGKLEKNLRLRIVIEKRNKFPEAFIVLIKPEKHEV